MARYAVTGAAGFIGSHIAEELVRRGQSVIAIDDFSTGKPENMDPFRHAVEFHERDLATADDLPSLFEGVDYIIHQAAIPSVPKSVAEPLRTHRANVDATLRVLIAARDVGARRVVYATSSAVYGDEPTLPKSEGMRPSPISPYGAHKLFNEGYAETFFHAYGLESIGLRYFNVFGPRQDASSPYSGVMALFIQSLLAQRQPTIFGDGEQSRDFVYVANVVRANLLACQGTIAGAPVFNVATGTAVTVNRLFERIRAILGSSMNPNYAPARAGDIRHSVADITRIQGALDFAPSVSFDEGLEHTIAWYKSKR